MSIFEQLSSYDHEQIVFCRDDTVGLKAIIAIHNTTLGPALGGTRMLDYATEADAVRDVLRLSRGMTYKAAVAGLDLGGGKAVIIGDPSLKSEAMFRSFGRFVDSLGGRYVTAEDMNTTVEDMGNIRRETKWVTGSEAAHGGSGDPSPVTAWGVFHGIRACLEVTYGSPDVAGRTVAIQGVGNVGWWLAKYLHDQGAKLLFADVSSRRLAKAVESFGGSILEGDEFYKAEADVLAPCAIGGIINPRTIPMLRAPIIAGGANNQLDDERRDGETLSQRNINYAPDYVINAGGLINVYSELRGYGRDKAMQDAANIFDTVKRVINRAKMEGTTTAMSANRVAEERIAAVHALKRVWLAKR